jgi:hypothetical protein
MPRFIDTRGNTKIAIAICGRCSRKFPYDELESDPNYPGLYVCHDDLDQLDPYRLPARPTEDISLDHPRPDVALTDFQRTPLYGGQQLDPVVNGMHLAASPITSLGPVRVWQPNTWYNAGDTITPQNIDDQNVDLPQRWFVVLVPGMSGPTPPIWPDETGVTIR